MNSLSCACCRPGSKPMNSKHLPALVWTSLKSAISHFYSSSKTHTTLLYLDQLYSQRSLYILNFVGLYWDWMTTKSEFYTQFTSMGTILDIIKFTFNQRIIKYSYRIGISHFLSVKTNHNCRKINTIFMTIYN